MFNLTKDSDKTEEIRNKAANLASNIKTNVENVTETVKQDAQHLGDMIQDQSAETKAQAVSVIESLKSLLNQYTSNSNVHEVKEQILDKAHQLTGLVKNEASHAYEVSRDKTVQAVHDKPIASLAIAVGVGIGTGVLLGYILGSKTHSK
jgi:ElaB/YqjD/DUF883 family membrane-anchored ribosome-binding protein